MFHFDNVVKHNVVLIFLEGLTPATKYFEKKKDVINDHSNDYQPYSTCNSLDEFNFENVLNEYNPQVVDSNSVDFFKEIKVLGDDLNIKNYEPFCDMNANQSVDFDPFISIDNEMSFDKNSLGNKNNLLNNDVSTQNSVLDTINMDEFKQLIEINQPKSPNKSDELKSSYSKNDSNQLATSLNITNKAVRLTDDTKGLSGYDGGCKAGCSSKAAVEKTFPMSNNLHLGRMNTKWSIDLVYADNIDDLIRISPKQTVMKYNDTMIGEPKLTIRVWFMTKDIYTDDFYSKIYAHLMDQTVANGAFYIKTFDFLN